MKAVAIHTIEYFHPETKKAEVAKPGETFEVDQKAFDYLVSIQAVYAAESGIEKAAEQTPSQPAETAPAVGGETAPAEGGETAETAETAPAEGGENGEQSLLG